MKTNRIYLWDNLKFFLILSVVLGHFVVQHLASPDFKSLFLFIYSFHMPLFIFISGAFHKNTKIGHKVFAFLSMGFLYKIVIFIIRTITDKNPKFDLFTEGGAPWYMFAMAAFILITYLLRNVDLKLRHKDDSGVFLAPSLALLDQRLRAYRLSVCIL